MVGAVSQLGNLFGVGLTEKISERILVSRGIEEVVDATTPGAGCFEAEVIGEFDDQVGEERVEEEEDYEDPFKDGVDED